MTNDASSQACLISLTSLKEWREDSGIATVGMMAPLSDQDYHSRDIITTARKSVSLWLERRQMKRSSPGRVVRRHCARIRVDTPPITVQWPLICACSYAHTLASARGPRPTIYGYSRQNGRGQVAFGLQLQALTMMGDAGLRLKVCSTRPCSAAQSLR